MARQNDIKVIECNLRASRSFPFASKTLGQNFIEIATRVLVGETVLPQEINPLDIRKVCVKAAQFSFSRLKGADPALGVEMSSTGEVACFGETLEESFLKSLIAIGFRIPKKGSKILVTLGKLRDKVAFRPIAGAFLRLGYSLIATEGTAKLFREHDIPCEKVEKISSGKHPNVADLIDAKKIDCVINTPNKFSHEELTDGYNIRRSAIDANIPLIINLQLVCFLISGLCRLRRPCF